MEENKILFWLESLQAKAPGCVVVLVGTFLDKIKIGCTTEQYRMKLKQISDNIDELMRRWNEAVEKNERLKLEKCTWFEPEILSFWPVSCTSEEGIEKLSDKLSEITFRYKTTFSSLFVCVCLLVINY